MAEKEKCEQELIHLREHFKELCSQYNQLQYSDIETRYGIIRKIVKSTESKFLIEQDFWCDYGYNMELGGNFYTNHNLVILDRAPVSFGDNIFKAPCGFHIAGHPVDVTQRIEGLDSGQQPLFKSTFYINLCKNLSQNSLPKYGGYRNGISNQRLRLTIDF